ncbi:MAG: hypothetical protein WBP46_00495 [Thiolinea sp.]
MSILGQRIHVIGNSCSGKSTLAAELGDILNIPVVELDALNWQPNWVGLNDTNPELFKQKICEATAGEAWILAGSYERFTRPIAWVCLDTIIWLDLPLPLLFKRVLKRSWQRWYSQELLWGTNRENFWRQLKVWNKNDSLIWWISTQYWRKRRSMLKNMLDPELKHIRFIRLTSEQEVAAFKQQLQHSLNPVTT